MAETKFPYLAKFLETTQDNQDLPEEVLSGEFGEIFQRKEMLSVSPDAPCPEYQSKSILEVGDKTDKTSCIWRLKNAEGGGRMVRHLLHN